jgi:glycosyltransferase involved in cell wall biosynthesis
MSSPAPLPLSVVIVARNEERNLERCLRSVRGWVGEIVVVLNNTTDSSADIAAAAGAHVYTLPWEGYRDTKNAAVDLATHTWVLALDADEEVSAALCSGIVHFFQGTHESCNGARFPRKVWFIDRWITHGDWYPDWSLRLFRRDRARWGGDAVVHEKVECAEPVTRITGDLHHYSFPSISDHVSKINAFADLFMRQQEESGARFSLVSAVFRPAWRFFRAYILKLGFLDGFPGLYIAVANAFGVFVRQSRLFEAANRKEPPIRTD